MNFGLDWTRFGDQLPVADEMEGTMLERILPG
jgi:hypothetical protein